MKSFTDHLKAHHRRLGCSLKDFAALCRCSLATAWNWLHGIGEPAEMHQAAILAKLATVRPGDVKPCVMGRPKKARDAK